MRRRASGDSSDGTIRTSKRSFASQPTQTELSSLNQHLNEHSHHMDSQNETNLHGRLYTQGSDGGRPTLLQRGGLTAAALSQGSPDTSYGAANMGNENFNNNYNGGRTNDSYTGKPAAVDRVALGTSNGVLPVYTSVHPAVGPHDGDPGARIPHHLLRMQMHHQQSRFNRQNMGGSALFGGVQSPGSSVGGGIMDSPTSTPNTTFPGARMGDVDHMNNEYSTTNINNNMNSSTMNSNSNLQRDHAEPTEYQPSIDLQDSFKSAALAVTQLYKEASRAATNQREQGFADGYRQAMKDAVALLRRTYGEVAEHILRESSVATVPPEMAINMLAHNLKTEIDSKVDQLE